MSKRTSKKIVSCITPEQYQDALGNYAGADAIAEKKLAQLNAELTRTREKFEPFLADLALRKEEAFQIIQTYCLENKTTLFDKARHIETVHGKIGFRIGMPRLKTLPKYTWDRVLEKVEQVLPQYVRIKKEVDKESLLLHRLDQEVVPHLATIGVFIDQDEAFYIELKKDTAPAI